MTDDISERVRKRNEEMERSLLRFTSQWGKDVKDCTFPDTMPEELRAKVIRLRRQIMLYGYMIYGLDEQALSANMWARLCKELENLQAVWGWQFGFYDVQFARWDETREDTLVTNGGCDPFIVEHATNILQRRRDNANKLLNKETESAR